MKRISTGIAAIASLLVYGRIRCRSSGGTYTKAPLMVDPRL